ncbi:hypothetical protein T10_6536 [Trichinella papuae]|uniref:C2H2-type domain-containing protein n=1 Tax=Trichinella papuae TaxID=268474 RepID=A0A0V1M1U0_9BILA|nr:hypothetical protein T10_6536 [Trichinella papuae]
MSMKCEVSNPICKEVVRHVKENHLYRLLDQIFQKYNELRKHVLVDNPLAMECSDCGKTFSQRKCLRRHLRSNKNYIQCSMPGCDHKFCPRVPWLIILQATSLNQFQIKLEDSQINSTKMLPMERQMLRKRSRDQQWIGSMEDCGKSKFAHRVDAEKDLDHRLGGRNMGKCINSASARERDVSRYLILTQNCESMWQSTIRCSAVTCSSPGSDHKFFKSTMARQLKENHLDKFVDQCKECTLRPMESNLKCPDCGDLFADPHNLKRPVQRMHRADFWKEKDGCHRVYCCRSSLQQHMKKKGSAFEDGVSSIQQPANIIVSKGQAKTCFEDKPNTATLQWEHMQRRHGQDFRNER